ncbi:hypothetical protein BDV95DRAFT_583070 [Massariosphaeria phaeospora]|uniref:Uncharacterized protein n=1 Tax=Massariosphaeria phaeospora TaxID=100035 RepID=A0A7C8I017_9PLEO|nr:hypothetical protein BDV95DRAFT_583070 [Massariosphaeria phaeospora]
MDNGVAPKSTHVSDPTIAPFLHPTFDPADYLNATLPSLSLSSASSRPLKQGLAVSLADLSSQTQDLLSQLNAHTTRLSTILTQLTDDILRSGGRLAYEVEVLRGETIGLTETLTEGLKEDVDKFVPGGTSIGAKESEDETASPITSPGPTEKATHKDDAAENTPDNTTPEYISQLRILSLVRARLETVIKVFGEAMHWTLPPSEVSLASSLISVSAPEPGSDTATREQRGKEFATSLRSEISDLVTGSDAETGLEAATVRIQALRDLEQVWKGTAEEKARAKFVEGLIKLAEDKLREVQNEKNKRQQRAGRSGSAAGQKPVPQPVQKTGGFLDNLQRIRGNIYLE